jgi:hypothetical protein
MHVRDNDMIATRTPNPSQIMTNPGVVLETTTWREAKRGQSTNRKGEMSRGASREAKNSKRNLNVTIVKYILSLL